MSAICPNCDATGPLPTNDIFFSCPTCNHAAYIDVDGLRPVFTFAAKLQPEDVEFYLKQSFDKLGLAEGYEIVYVNPLYLPFWQTGRQSFLARGSSGFHGEGLDMLQSEAIPLDISTEREKFDLIDIDTQPPGADKNSIFFVPIFRINVSYQKRVYIFFVNAVDGNVYGDPIPFTSGQKAVKIFPYFIAIFFLFLINSFLFKSTGLAIGLNFLTLFVFFQITKKGLGKKT